MEIFDARFTLDYTRMFGGVPQQLSPDQLTEQWKPLMEGMASTQHLTSQIIINLPQADSRTRAPDACIVFANVIVHLTKTDAQGYHKRMTSNGARYIIELVRTSKLGQPWRIKSLKADPIWEDGDTQILKGPQPPRSYGKGF